MAPNTTARKTSADKEAPKVAPTAPTVEAPQEDGSDRRSTNDLLSKFATIKAVPVKEGFKRASRVVIPPDHPWVSDVQDSYNAKLPIMYHGIDDADGAAMVLRTIADSKGYGTDVAVFRTETDAEGNPMAGERIRPAKGKSTFNDQVPAGTLMSVQVLIRPRKNYGPRTKKSDQAPETANVTASGS